jgi:DNA-directed RNA polymerase subunit RPC12/RpoP
MQTAENVPGLKVACPHCSQHILHPAAPQGTVLLPPQPVILARPAVEEVELVEQRPARYVGDHDPPLRRRRFRCPYCGSTEIPVTRSRISTAGWIVLVVLLLVTIIFFWIGLLIKEEYRECYDCGMRVGS